MNLNAYDNVDESIVNNTWINPLYRKLYSREIKYYPHYCLLKRYNDKLAKDEYFLCLSNNIDKNHAWHTTERNGNSVKVHLDEIWNKSSLKHINDTIYVSVDKVDDEPDLVIYCLNI